MIPYHKIPLAGTYNKAVSLCLTCNHYFMSDKRYGSLFDNVIGVADSAMGLMLIWECPICFEKWFYHAGDHYDYFLDAIEAGTNKHYKKESTND